MKLYKVIDGSVVSTEVVKETKCFYYVNDYHFDWRSRIDKKSALLSPVEAIQERYNRALESFGMRLDNFKRASAALCQIRKVKQDFERKNNKKLKIAGLKSCPCNKEVLCPQVEPCDGCEETFVAHDLT